jgi:acyl dehydratase
VAVYGYLTHPLVESLGDAWLTASNSSVRFFKPAYEGDELAITLARDGDEWLARCENQEGTLLAELRSRAGDVPPLEPQGMFDAPAKRHERIEMTWDTVVPDQPFEPWHWQITEDGNATFAQRVDDDLPAYRHAAHPHWLLGIANLALTREYVMPAWVHVGSEVRFRELLKVGDTVEVRTVPLEKWERKGRQFLKLYLTYTRGQTVVTEILHTAIFRMAE